MANVRYEKKVIEGEVVTVEIDPAADEIMRRFSVAADIQRRMGFSLDAAANSTLGAGKHSGSMRRAMAARNRTVRTPTANQRTARAIRTGQRRYGGPVK